VTGRSRGPETLGLTSGRQPTSTAMSGSVEPWLAVELGNRRQEAGPQEAPERVSWRDSARRRAAGPLAALWIMRRPRAGEEADR
jgi:hypothetical protein